MECGGPRPCEECAQKSTKKALRIAHRMNSLQLRLQVEYLRPETNAGLFEREQRQIHKNVSRQTAGDTKSLLGQRAQDSALLPDPARDAYCPKAPRTMIARRVPRAGTAPESVPCPARLLAPRGLGRQRFSRGIKALRPSCQCSPARLPTFLVLRWRDGRVVEGARLLSE